MNPWRNSIILSLALHAGVLGYAAVAATSSFIIRYFTVERGTATIELIASIESKAETPPPDPTPAELKPDPVKSAPPEPLQPMVEPPERREHRPEPTATAEPVQLASLPPPPKMEKVEQRPKESRVSEPIERVQRTDEAVVELLKVDSVASPSSQALNGAETPDELPRALTSNPAPGYPRAAWAARVEGKVILRVEVSREGTASKVEILTSSGDYRLDQSAMTTVRRWRFEPARRQGIAMAYEVSVPIKFWIRDQL